MIVNGKRALAYTQRVAWVKPIVGADNIEEIGVLGWHLIAKKGEFKEGDMCVYFEIDSKLPAAPWSEFMMAKHYKVKTMKLNKFGVISQGLALPVTEFEIEIPDEEGVDLTDKLGVTYSVEEDNKRKASVDKYKKMAQRHAKLFKTNKLVKWLYERDWGKKLLFVFLGKKRDKKAAYWPEWVVKTDEERAQNLPFLFPGDGTKWYVTEKIDGSSTTFTMKRGRFGKYEFYVCSRNVCFDKPEKDDKLFYETNIYTEMAQKYNIEAVLRDIMENNLDVNFVTIQGETFGKSVQNRDYGLAGHDFMAFNFIYNTNELGTVRKNPKEMTDYLTQYNIPCVPILDEEFVLPETVDEMIAYAASEVSKVDGGMREGVVLRTADGKQSFKAVSNEFLMKYHS